MWPVLQVALDLMHAKRALTIAKESVEGGADWIEVGTPLLKSEGTDCIRMLRKEFPHRKIVADTKTMDVGAFEVEIAVKAGADIITVMGLADDSTISEAVLAARKYGAEVMVDLMNVPDRVQRAKEAEALGAAYVCLHMGIDQQMKGEGAPTDVLKAITVATSLPVAAAGGMTSETAPAMVAAGASIIIVGGAIIKDKDVTGAARRVSEAIHSGSGIPTELARRYGEEGLFEAFSKVSTPNISDAHHKLGVMRGLLPHIKHGQRMVGRALTVQTANGDWAKPVEAIDRATPGTVIVVDVGGADTAVWGELATVSAQVNGVVGLVVDGA
ncbi:MAG: 3-hexulose-6-phosphate synthase, partial [Candidatus Methanomethylophilaceae archaeon]